VARIFIVGSGVVGTATGRGFVAMGHQVSFIDLLPSRVATLQREGLDARVGLDLRGEQPSFIFLTLPTPHFGREYDLTAFRTGSYQVGEALRTAEAVHTVVVRSTVPPLTCDTVVQPLLEGASGKQLGHGFALASNPEFLRAASAAEDFRWPWMTVVASRSKRTQERLRDLLLPFGGEIRLFDDPRIAEMIKCTHNIFNAAKISFWNEMWLVCQRLGIDQDDVATTVARSAEGSFNPEYGIRGGAPYGGVCLPKDTNGFLGFAAQLGLELPLLEAVVDVNEALERHVRTELEGMPPLPAHPKAGVPGTCGEPVIDLIAQPAEALAPEALVTHSNGAAGHLPA
jgi:UDPglucose 6-dehydrogenase